MYQEDTYRDRMLGVGYVTHYLVKMAGDKIQGIVKFKLNPDKTSLRVEYLCSIPQRTGTGKLLLDILKDFVRTRGFKYICLDMFNITLHEYYTKQGFRDDGLTECGRIWKPTDGGRKRTRRARKLYTRNNGRNKILS
jgi:GNAT superfamily N-acetyltransferase